MRAAPEVCEGGGEGSTGVYIALPPGERWGHLLRLAEVGDRAARGGKVCSSHYGGKERAV